VKTPSRSDLDAVSHAELVGLVLELLNHVEVLEAENAELRARCEKLEAQVRESKRAGAPFSKGNLKAERKKAGRKAGKGVFRRRPEPLAGPADVVENVSVPLDSQECPLCGTPLEVSEELATVEDTPPQPTRRITRFHVEVGVCPQCGWRGRGTHADDWNIRLAAAHRAPIERGANPSKQSSPGYFEIESSPTPTTSGFLMASALSTIAATSCAFFADRKSNRPTTEPSAASVPPSSPEKSPIAPKTSAAPPSTRP
jgi:hypothetical protein